MRLMSYLSTMIIGLASLNVSPIEIEAQLSAQEIVYVLSDHNLSRRTLATPSASNMLEIQWDPILAQVAQNYANGCSSSKFIHNPDRTTQYTAAGGQNAGISGGSAYVGENWYSGAATNLTDPAIFGGATYAWTVGTCEGYSQSGSKITCTNVVCSEQAAFYQTGGCSQSSTDYGHFTQVMWATTLYVGCGYSSQCGTVCDYAPGGNIGTFTSASQVWQFGTPGSACPSSQPYNDNGLCSATNGGGSSGGGSTNPPSSPTSAPSQPAATTLPPTTAPLIITVVLTFPATTTGMTTTSWKLNLLALLELIAGTNDQNAITITVNGNVVTVSIKASSDGKTAQQMATAITQSAQTSSSSSNSASPSLASQYPGVSATQTNSGSSSSGSNAGAIAGGVIAALVVVGIAAGVGYYFYRKKQSAALTSTAQMSSKV